MWEREAKLHYGDAHFSVIKPGSFVLCAATGQRIPLEELRYWNVQRQEAYRDAGASLQRMQELENRKREEKRRR